ncbi:MAG: hypothetical protein WC607_02200 [Candidatus Micrarchaeia archaeon]
MRGLIDWLSEKENTYLALHLAGVFLVALAAELFYPASTKTFFPGVLLLAAASFMYFYPVAAIKKQGLFAEYLIELRLLWLVVLGAFVEYLVYSLCACQFMLAENAAIIAAGFAVLVVAFYARSRLKERLVANRGWK